MADIGRLKSYPDVTFIEETSFEKLKNQLISDYEKRYQEVTGESITLAAADPYRLILYSCAVAIYQGYQYEDRAGKMGLLKYSTGEFLDNIGAMKKVERNPAKPAYTQIRFTLSIALSQDAVIPKGMRLKGLDLYFELTEGGVIKAGELSVDLPAKCQTVGTVGNGYLPGVIKTLVDPLPYTLSAVNVSESSGGSERETDEELAERIYLAPSAYSTAGPEAAYEYWVKTFSPSITGCKVVTESAGEVDIYVTANGKIPDDGFIKELEKYVQDGERRPLTDHVVVKKPEKVECEIEFTYYIRNTDRDMEQSIQEAVKTACNTYIKWQEQIGRDLTPSRLIYEIMDTGVQSVEIKSPVYAALTDSQMAVVSDPIIHYGGMRDG